MTQFDHRKHFIDNFGGNDEKVNIEKVICEKDFIAWFIMNCFPEGLDEENDMSIYDVMEDNYSFDVDWFNKFNNYYDGVFEENDGYVDNPNSIMVQLNNHKELIIEFHPGDIIFFMNNLKIGCTGPDYSIRVIPVDEYIKLTKDLCYENKLFLLPMVEVKEYEETKFREIVELIISNFSIKKCCEKQIVEIIISNCLS